MNKTILLTWFWLISVSIFAAPTKVRLILNWKPEAEFGGFYAAKLAGHYEKAGLDVEILPGGVGTPVIQMVEGGKAEFGISSADEVVISRAKGASLIALFAAYQTSPTAIMTRSERGFKHLKDVFTNEGTLAAERGLAYMRFLEKKYGFSKLKIVPYIGGVSQMQSDPKMSQQCFLFAEPLQARKAGLKPQAFLVAESGFNPYNTIVITQDGYLKKNPEVVEAFVKATRQGWEAYQKNPTAANKHMAELNPTMDLETFTEGAKAQSELIENGETKKHGIGTMNEERWTVLAQQLKDLGLVDKTFPAATYFRPLSQPK